MSILIDGMNIPEKGEYHMTLYVCYDGSAYVDVASFPVDEDRFQAVSVLPKKEEKIMTLDELKVEAKKLGYTLIKNPESIKMLPCTCGSKRRTEWFGVGQIFYSCNRCGKKSPPANTVRGAKRAWNEMIEKEGEEDAD